MALCGSFGVYLPFAALRHSLNDWDPLQNLFGLISDQADRRQEGNLYQFKVFEGHE